MDNLLTLEVEAAEDNFRWTAEFTSQYIEEITHKAGNFKKYAVFVKMLCSSFSKNNDSVSVDLLTSADLELLKARKKGVTSTTPSENSLSNRNQLKRYIILTYSGEFDQVHYPLSLSFEEVPKSSSLQRTITRLRKMIEEQSDTNALPSSEKEKEMRQIISQLRQDNTELRHRLRQTESRNSKSGSSSFNNNPNSNNHSMDSLTSINTKLNKQVDFLNEELKKVSFAFEKFKLESSKEISSLKSKMTIRSSSPIPLPGNSRSFDLNVQLLDEMRSRVWELERELNYERQRHSKRFESLSRSNSAVYSQRAGSSNSRKISPTIRKTDRSLTPNRRNFNSSRPGTLSSHGSSGGRGGVVGINGGFNQNERSRSLERLRPRIGATTAAHYHGSYHLSSLKSGPFKKSGLFPNTQKSHPPRHETSPLSLASGSTRQSQLQDNRPKKIPTSSSTVSRKPTGDRIHSVGHHSNKLHSRDPKLPANQRAWGAGPSSRKSEKKESGYSSANSQSSGGSSRRSTRSISSSSNSSSRRSKTAQPVDTTQSAAKKQQKRKETKHTPEWQQPVDRSYPSTAVVHGAEYWSSYSIAQHPVHKKAAQGGHREGTIHLEEESTSLWIDSRMKAVPTQEASKAVTMTYQEGGLDMLYGVGQKKNAEAATDATMKIETSNSRYDNDPAVRDEEHMRRNENPEVDCKVGTVEGASPSEHFISMLSTGHPVVPDSSRTATILPKSDSKLTVQDVPSNGSSQHNSLFTAKDRSVGTSGHPMNHQNEIIHKENRPNSSSPLLGMKLKRSANQSSSKDMLLASGTSLTSYFSEASEVSSAQQSQDRASGMMVGRDMSDIDNRIQALQSYLDNARFQIYQINLISMWGYLSTTALVLGWVYLLRWFPSRN